ncbi:trigger factor [Sulfurovum sp. XGS-02]|uniref:trigger factor n=1 Tax=Sulfurovum sp. XGS-02 TaxID=2925411 RepID=UPI00204F2587|nr:trigger factor [Sulfurovum sp. XGS-02]UPT77565.1 trigger factor [Sulfurovum sp. XGS-02]
MKVTVNKVDDANIIVSGTIENSAVEENINKMAVQAGKEMKVDGFRKGKVPPHVVKQMHGDKLAQDAEGEVLRELIDAGMKEAGINPADMLGQPTFKKYDKTDAGIDVEVEISTRPVFEAEGHMDVLPAFERPTASEKEVEEKLNEIAAQQAPYTKIKRKRMVRDGDMVVIDFEGFVDGVAFDGGKAEKFSLKIGSGQFIPGFEEQIIGMKYDEEKTITVTFPEAYQSKDLAGKEAEFKVKLHEIQEQVPAELNDELAQKLLQGEENATLEMLTDRVRTQIESTEISKLYNEDLKPKLVEALVEKFDFALPNNIVEQEIDAKINAKAREMSEEELNSFKDNPEKIEALREEVRADAVASVKATFIVDALAKKEDVSVDDQEVSQAIYYEAMMSGQDPQEVIKYYQENNLLPAVKMGMIEDKLFGKMLGLDK